MFRLWLLTLLSTIFVLPGVDSKKLIKVAIFVEDDDQYELSVVALASAMRRVNLYQMTNYFLRPYIYRTKSVDALLIGDLVCNLTEKGIAAIFGPESPEINEIIQSVSATLQIPQFQMFPNPKLSSYSDRLLSEEPSTVFNLHPSTQTLSKALATLVEINNWNTFVFIYEEDDALLRLQEALKLRKPTREGVIFKKLRKNNHRSVLKAIKNTGVQRFILDCKADHILEILREAKEYKLLSEYHSYILTNLDTHTLDWSSIKDVNSNITTFRLLNTTGGITGTMVEWNMLVNYTILDTVQNEVVKKELDRFRLRYPFKNIKPETVRVKSALLYDALNLFLTVFSEEDAKEELVLDPVSCEKSNTSRHGIRIAEAIAEKKFSGGVLLKPLTGPFTEFTDTGQRSSFKLEILELRPKGFRTIALWNSSAHQHIQFTISSKSWEEKEKEEIQGKTFKVVSRIGPPYLMYKPNPEGLTLVGNDRFEGYAMDLMMEICRPRNLNCSYTFSLVPDEQYGSYDPKTKKWNGLIRELLELKADLAICDLTITYERRKAVDFTMPFMTLGISILYAKAVKEPPELLSFSHPLSLDVWLYMATSYLVISMIIFLVARLNPNDWENPHPCDPCPKELENIWNMKNCLWLNLGSIMAQGCDILPKGIPTRMVTSMWWFFSLIMTACYTANLAAFLTMERMGPTIESAEDLAAQNKIKYGCVADGATAAFFRETNFSTYHRMWVQMESADPTVFERDNKEGVKRVLNSKRQYAFLMESSSIEYEMERHCDLMQVGGTLDSKGYGIAMPTNARYRKSINEAVLKLQEMGVLLELKEKWWKKMNGGGQCKEEEHSGDEAATELGLDHVGGVFVVLAAGIGVALVIAACEFLWSVRKVAVVQHLTLKEAFHQELRFAVDIWARKKTVITSPTKEISREMSRLESRRMSRQMSPKHESEDLVSVY